MSEPILVFRKGEGWVYDSTYWKTVTMVCGTKVRLEIREPLDGERFGNVIKKESTWLDKEGYPTYRFEEFFLHESYDYLRVKDFSWNPLRVERVYVVAVPE